MLVDSLERRLSHPLAQVKVIEGEPKKRAKPEDLVRVFDTLLLNVSELAELEDEAEQIKENAAKSLAFKALRCFYLALSYSFTSKWNEAVALLDRASQQIRSAKSHLDECATPLPVIAAKLDAAEQSILGHKSQVRANAFLETIQSQTKEEKEAAQVPSLVHALDRFDGSFAKRKELISFPPDFEAAKCKPLLFDLALSECDFPNLDSRKAARSFWSFWK